MFIPIVVIIIIAIYLYSTEKRIENLSDEIDSLKNTIKHLTGKTVDEIDDEYYENSSEI